MVEKINRLLSEFIDSDNYESKLNNTDEKELKKLADLIKKVDDKINNKKESNDLKPSDHNYITEIITVVTNVFSGNYERKIPQNETALLNSLGSTINMLITEVQWRSSELDKKNHFFSKITETMSDIVFVYEIENQRIIYKNRSDSRMSRLLFSEKGLIDMVKKEDVHLVEAELEKYSVMKGEDKSSVEFRVKDDFGDDEWFLMKASVFLSNENGITTQIIGTIINTTEFHLTEHKIREREERFRKLSESTNNAIIVINGAQKIITWSKGAERMFKYEEEEIIEESISIIIPAKYKEEGNKGERLNIKKIIGTSSDIEGVDRDGKIFPVEISLSEWKIDNKKYFGAIIRDITKRKENERNLIQSNKEKETLLKEVHHRVKNNLQIINGLLDIQIRKVDDENAKLVLRDSRSRIKSIALVHEQLYQHEHLSAINFTKYLQTLCNEISVANFNMNKRVETIFKCDDISIDINRSIPLGLIANELLTNCYKHAFSLKEEGKVLIVLTRDASTKNIELSIIDNGVGLPIDFDERKKNSLGYKIISSLVNQIDGTLTFTNNDDGMTVKICF